MYLMNSQHTTGDMLTSKRFSKSQTKNIYKYFICLSACSFHSFFFFPSGIPCYAQSGWELHPMHV